MSYVSHNLSEMASGHAYGRGGGEKSPLSGVLLSLRGWVWGVGGISFVINMLTLTGPLFMLQVYDRVLVSGSVPTLIALGGLALALYLFFGVLQGLRARVLYRIGQQVDSNLINQLSELTTRRARLEAERDGKERIEFPPRLEGIVREKAAETELRQALLMRARTGSRTKRKEQLEDQIQQLESQISGLEAQVSAQAEELDLIDDELAGVKALFAKKIVTKNRISSLERDRTRMVGQKSELLSEIAGLKETVSERRMQILQIDEESRAEVLQELQDVVSKIAELELQKVTVEDELNRLEIRSPRAGYVHQLAAHTIGGVVPAGETIMDIVPREDQLVVDAQVTPSDIDQVYRNQEAFIRFPGLDHRTTPRLLAKVKRIAADETIDPGTGEHFYNIRLKIPKEELAKLNGQALVPGMPVEAFVTTANRTILAYLMKPVTDQIAHAMKEG
jgi:HlyD family type I secretion membrane fusion protein